MPEGDVLHRVAARLRLLEGSAVGARSPHPRGAATGVAARVDGRVLVSVAAVGKHLLLEFSGGVVLRSHLGMKGRWRVDPPQARLLGTPWLVLETPLWRAAQWHGPTLTLETRPVRRLGPDILDPKARVGDLVAAISRADGRKGVAETLLDQRVVSGLGTVWVSEVLHAAGLPPRLPVGAAGPDALHRMVVLAREAMSASVAGPRVRPSVYRRAGRGCPRCGATIERVAVGDSARGIYWCPGCQNEDSARAGRTV